MKFRLILLGIFLQLGLPSCTKELSSEQAKSVNRDSLPIPSDSANVYVAGGIFSEDTLSGLQKIHAMYWKNGQPFTLDNNNSFTTSIALSGNDVYIGGAIAKPNGFDAAAYWKNGTAILLTNGQTNARVTSLVINGSDVYASGWITAGNGNPVAVFWKNGQQTLLSDSSYYCLANGIAVNGSDVYVAGQFMNLLSDSSTVICWKNGVALPITGYPFSYATCIQVSGNDVYMGGVSSVSNGYSNGATYWKNGNSYTLSAGNFGYQVNSLAVDGDSLYAAGFFGSPYNNAAYWQNGQAFHLSAPPVPSPVYTGEITSYASSIIIHGKDLYIAGGTNNVNGNFKALYWKNGQPNLLKNGADSIGLYASSIAVQ